MYVKIGMRRLSAIGIVVLLSGMLLSGMAPSRSPAEESAPEPERRAIAFLAREVAAWPAENKCFSCHNNGDAARALYAAIKERLDVPADRLRETTAWLSRPGEWRKADIPAEFRDDRLSAIQFGAALVSATEAGELKSRPSLAAAADLVAAVQDADGSWQVDASGQAGSPVTYGAALATWSARRTLLAAGEPRFVAAIAKADAWLRRHEAQNTPDAAAGLLALSGAKDDLAVMRRKQCLTFLLQAQTDRGGWGPYRTSPPEVFDAALALLALSALPRTAESEAAMARGRKYLIAEQLDDGSWTETTRPSGARSYAQRLSTTGWATLALLATRQKSQ